MLRRTGAVLAGYVFWSLLWLLGNQLFFAEAARSAQAGERVESITTLLPILLLSMFCSLLAGWVTARLQPVPPRREVIYMALLLLVTGIGVQASVWSMMPLWYHLAFLGLLLPLSLAGGRLARA